MRAKNLDRSITPTAMCRFTPMWVDIVCYTLFGITVDIIPLRICSRKMKSMPQSNISSIPARYYQIAMKDWGRSTHSADSSNERPDLHTTHTPTSEVNLSVVTEWPLTSEVHAASVVTGWPPACLHKLLSRGHQSRRKPRMKDVSNLIIGVSYKPHSRFKPTWVSLKILLCASIYISYIDNKIILVLGPYGKDRKYSSRLYEITPRPSIQHIPLGEGGSTIPGVSTLWHILVILEIL